jgi:2-keto-4-pentenoate hydratase/2-oxohepta-3-ene-1,7-dioic acid hydratase in catechol pathway
LKIAKYDADRIAAVLDGPRGAKLVDLNLAYAGLVRRRGESLAYELAASRVPADLLQFIRGGKTALEAAGEALGQVREVLKNAADEGIDALRGPRGEAMIFDLGAARLRAPLPSLGSKLICMGRNFASHSAAARAARASSGEPQQKVPESSLQPKRPAGFIKFADTVMGPDEDVTYPSRTRKFDYEVEVAAIIGTQGKDIAAADAMSHVFGYSIFCDYSARDQTTDLEDMNWVRHHKNFDCAAALGPWIVTADEIGDPHALRLVSRVNGEVRQDGNTSDMIYKFPRIIEYYSVDQTLYPGDLFASGTPRGTGMENPDGSWFLKPGDLIEFDVPAIGRFANRIVGKRA